jgi:hypothetical protein
MKVRGRRSRVERENRRKGMKGRRRERMKGNPTSEKRHARAPLSPTETHPHSRSGTRSLHKAMTSSVSHRFLGDTRASPLCLGSWSLGKVRDHRLHLHLTSDSTWGSASSNSTS